MSSEWDLAFVLQLFYSIFRQRGLSSPTTLSAFTKRSQPRGQGMIPRAACMQHGMAAYAAITPDEQKSQLGRKRLPQTTGCPEVSKGAHQL